MFCRRCGAQASPGHRFCGSCGAPLDPGSSGSLTGSRNDVNVSVNVGIPTINAQGAGPNPASEAAARLLQAVTNSLVRKSRNNEDLNKLRESVHSKLTYCHDLVSEIERSLDAEFLTPSSSLRRRYLHALEMTSEAAERFDTATTSSDLMLADTLLGQAVGEFQHTKQISTSSSTRTERDGAG